MDRHEHMVSVRKKRWSWAKKVDPAGVERFNEVARALRGDGKRKKEA